jgi:type I restriction enzyme S subunit
MLIPSLLVHPPFFRHLFKSDLYIQALQTTSNLVRDGQAMRYENFTLIDLPLPATKEQRQIALFLDQETEKIDALIEEKRRLIELLKEKRQAVISHAVAKGLDANAPTVISEAVWLGAVPGSWEVLPIKWLARVESGHTPDKKIEAYWEGGDVPWVSLNDTGFLRDNDLITETAYYTTAAGIENSSARLLPAGAVVFSRDATIGRCAITTRPMAVSQHFIAWICGDRVLPEYLLRVCHSMQQELERLSTGATIKTIGMADIGALVMPLPPMAEQEQIVQYIRRQIGQIDTLIAEANKAQCLLQERRSALISAAVTGKIDVRNYIPNEAV